jgi:mannosyltransferase OCH1-like enzyme
LSNIKTYIDLRDLNFHTDEIPKIIFRTGRYSLVNLPVEIQSLYENELENNPEYTLFYFDDEDCLSFIREKMNENVLTAYQSLIPTAFKADLWRYAVLYTYGGIYLDFTMHSLISFNKILISGKKEIYVRDIADMYGMYNAFIATVPKSEILKKAIEKVCFNVSNKLLGQIPLDVTGPSMLFI